MLIHSKVDEIMKLLLDELNIVNKQYIPTKKIVLYYELERERKRKDGQYSFSKLSLIITSDGIRFNYFSKI